MKRLFMIGAFIVLSNTMLGAEGVINMRAHVTNDVLTVETQDVDFGRNLMKGDSIDATSLVNVSTTSTTTNLVSISIEDVSQLTSVENPYANMMVYTMNKDELTDRSFVLDKTNPTKPGRKEAHIPVNLRLNVPNDENQIVEGDYKGTLKVRVIAGN